MNDDKCHFLSSQRTLVSWRPDRAVGAAADKLAAIKPCASQYVARISKAESGTGALNLLNASSVSDVMKNTPPIAALRASDSPSPPRATSQTTPACAAS